MDRRTTPANARAALSILRGTVDAPHFTDGEAAVMAAAVTDLLDQPSGRRDRQLLWGEAVTVIDRHDGWAFVQSAKDGYCGYVAQASLGPPVTATHRVAVGSSHCYETARVQGKDLACLSFGSLVRVIGSEGKFSQTAHGYIPSVHLRPLTLPFDDPAAVAALFLGSPYLWGGNSRSGIDCSGLVQTALLACNIACPADSDQQRVIGNELSDDAALQRGDLLFWKGHVAMAVDAKTLIHANGHSMSVACEDIESCVARIFAQDGLSVLARRRL